MLKTVVTIKSYSLEHPIKNLLMLILYPKVQQEICLHQQLLGYYHHFQFGHGIMNDEVKIFKKTCVLIILFNNGIIVK